MLLMLFKSIKAYSIYFSNQVELSTANMLSRVHYPFALNTDATPILSVLQSMPYVQAFLLSLFSSSKTGFYVTMSAYSGSPSFRLTSYKLMYMVIDYNYNYYHDSFCIFESGNQAVNHIVELPLCYLIAFTIEIHSLDSSTVDLSGVQISFNTYCNGNYQFFISTFFSEDLFGLIALTVIRYNMRLADTGVHAIQYFENYVWGGQVINSLYDGDLCKHGVAFYGISYFTFNQKKLYFKMNHVADDQIKIFDIQVRQRFKLVHNILLNYPFSLRQTSSQPNLTDDSQYFSPYQQTNFNCSPCFVQFVTGQYQCLHLYKYYSAGSRSCQLCFSYCISCTNIDSCFIRTPFSTSNDLRTQCLCDPQYYPHSNRKICNSCPEHCRACDLTLCYGCAPNSVLHNGRCLCDLHYFQTGETNCQPCGNNCLKCLSQNECLCPESRHYSFVYSSECLPCQTGCQICSSSVVCIACILEAELQQSGQCVCISKQQVLEEFVCVPCNPQCLACFPDNRCSCSKLGQFLDPFQICTNCNNNCLICASQAICLQCANSKNLAEGRCYNQCPANSNFSSLTLACVCNPPYYSLKSTQTLSCYLDKALGEWPPERLKLLVDAQSSAKNVSRQLSNALSVLFMLGVATLLGDAIQSLAIFKLHLFNLLPIHPFLDVVLNVFERIFDGQLFRSQIKKFESLFTDFQMAPLNSKLANYTSKRIFLVNSVSFAMQICGIAIKQALIALLRYLVRNRWSSPSRRIVFETKMLLSCSKIELLTYVSIQLLSFSRGWVYFTNALLCFLLVSLILFSQLRHKHFTASRFSMQTQIVSLSNIRIMLVACFILFSTFYYLQIVPPILLNSLFMAALLLNRHSIKKSYFIKKVVESVSILLLESYLLLGIFFNQSEAYSYAVYSILAACAIHLLYNLIRMVEKVNSATKDLLQGRDKIKPLRQKHIKRKKFIR